MDVESIEIARDGTVIGHTAAEDAAKNDSMALERVCKAVRSRAQLNSHELAAVAAALLRPMVRDACLGLSVTSNGDDAAALWHQIRTSDSALPTIPRAARAEAAALAAHHHWVYSDITTARRLIRQAQQWVPGHRLAGLLAQGLSTLTATEGRQLGITGLAIATRLGVTLPGLPA